MDRIDRLGGSTRRYPEAYRNSEGRDRYVHPNYSIGRESSDPRHFPRSEQLSSYPIHPEGARHAVGALHNFDYTRHGAPAAQIRRNDQRYRDRPAQGVDLGVPRIRAAAARHNENMLAHLPNDPGYIRAVADQDGRHVGAMNHPQSNPRGLVQARREPLTYEGRQQIRRHQDSHNHGQRPSDLWVPNADPRTLLNGVGDFDPLSVTQGNRPVHHRERRRSVPGRDHAYSGWSGDGSGGRRFFV